MLCTGVQCVEQARLRILQAPAPGCQQLLQATGLTILLVLGCGEATAMPCLQKKGHEGLYMHIMYCALHLRTSMQLQQHSSVLLLGTAQAWH
jgi:hypothetical protein